MNEEITDVKPPMGFPHITDLAGSEATILQVANSQGDILGYATLNDIDAYIEQKVSETVHSFSQKQIFQDVTINGTFDGNNVINSDKLNGALAGLNPFIPLEINNTVFQINVGDYGIVSGDILMFALGIDHDETRTVIITITNVYGIPHFTVIHNDVDIEVNFKDSIITISRQWTMYMCYLYVRHISN